MGLMPEAEIWPLSGGEIVDAFGVPRKLAEFRLSLIFDQIKLGKSSLRWVDSVCAGSSVSSDTKTIS